MSAKADDVRSVKVCIIGGEHSGKSKLLQAMVAPEVPFTDAHKPTLGVDFGLQRNNIFTLKIWDIPGSEIISRIKPAYFKGTEAFILTVDLTQDKKKAFKTAKAWLEAARKITPHTPIILVGTKDDLENRVLTEGDLDEFAADNGIHHRITTSAKRALGLEALQGMIFQSVGKKMAAAPQFKSDQEAQQFRDLLAKLDSKFGKHWNDKNLYKSVLHILNDYVIEHQQVDTMFRRSLVREVNMTKLDQIIERMATQPRPTKKDLCDSLLEISKLDKVPNSHLDEHLFYIREKLRPHLDETLFATLQSHDAGKSSYFP